MHVDAAPVRFLQHKGQRIVTRITAHGAGQDF